MDEAKLQRIISARIKNINPSSVKDSFLLLVDYIAAGGKLSNDTADLLVFYINSIMNSCLHMDNKTRVGNEVLAIAEKIKKIQEGIKKRRLNYNQAKVAGNLLTTLARYAA